MKELTAYCGLDCGHCDARIATISNDDELRARTAALWCEWNNTDEIKPEHINCLGCKADGVKTYFCTCMCEVRKCCIANGYATCADCAGKAGCEKLAPFLDNKDARNNIFGERIETRRLILRPWRESDAETLFRYASDPDVGPRAGWPPHKDIEESRRVIRDIFTNDRTWAVTLRETDEAIGCMGYYIHGESNIAIGENDAEIGYWIAKPYWNRGIATEALGAMVNYCFNVKGFLALWSDFFIDNPASGRVMEKCGFKDTGQTNWCSHLYHGDDRPVHIMKLEYALEYGG
ncbi:MAG: GNAT family N-acetyltransferase [Candidatus Cryptobacteroides sp.]